MEISAQFAFLKTSHSYQGTYSDPDHIGSHFYEYNSAAIVKIVVATHWAVPSFVTLAVMSYAAARLVTLFWQRVSSLPVFAISKDKRNRHAAGGTGEQ